MVAVRPLRVEELAEVLEFEFDAAQGVIPKYRVDWQLDNQTQAVLSTCSSLVAIVKEPWTGRKVVQFSHFSVKEFLMSNRLGDFSQYRIHPISAHTILTQACLGVLLHLDNRTRAKDFPLAEYAARHWVEHARLEDVASRVKAGMEMLFDSDKPHFAEWVEIYDIDDVRSRSWHFSCASNPRRNPLYYSVLCGFYDLVKLLAIKHPRDINAICGRYGYPLFTAISENNVEVAELLLEHGARVDVQGTTGETMLLKVLKQRQSNLVSKVKLLLKHGADVNVRDDTLTSSLHLAESRGELEVAEMLIKHKADVNSENNKGMTPLHILLERWTSNEDDFLNHVRLLFQHGAEVNIRDKNNDTPLHATMRRAWFKFAQILLEHGADATAENNDGKTPLHILSERRTNNEDDVLNHARLLLEHGAEVNKRDKNYETPLHLTIRPAWFKFAQILLEHGADATAENNDGKNPLHILSEHQTNNEEDVLNHARLLLEHGVEVNKRDKNYETPLHVAIRRAWFKLARILLEQGADATVENNDGKTPLHMLSELRVNNEDDVLSHARLLLEHGAEANKRDKDNDTPLHATIRRAWFKLARILLEQGADATVENNDGKTPLHILSELRKNNEDDVLSHARLLLERGAEANKRDKDKDTPLHVTIRRACFKLARILLEHGADANAENNQGETPLHVLSKLWIMYNEVIVLNHAQLSLERGAEANRQDKAPLLLTMVWHRLNLAHILLEHGADATEGDKGSVDPLHILSKGRCHGNLDIMWPSLGHGVAANRRGKNSRMTILPEMGRDMSKFVRILLEHGANANAKENNGQTPWRILLSEPQISDEAPYEGTAAWLFQGKKFKDWMSTGSLLWVHGKRKFLLAFTAQNLIVSDLRTSGVREERHLVSHAF
jgi:ankyrin repeat protein